MHETKTAFVGRITTSADARNAAFRVKLYVSDTELEIISAEGDEWSWSMDEVTITRTSVDRFHLELGDEDLYFLPVDTRGFLTNVVEEYSETPVEPHRGWLRRRIEEAQATGDDASGYEYEEVLEATTDEPAGKRRHVHEWAEGKAVGVVTRRCVSCGQVSIDATGLTSTFEASLTTA